MNRTSTLGILATTLLILSTSASAGIIECTEFEKSPLQANREQFQVTLTSLQEIKDPKIVKDHDSAEYVQIEILSRDPKNTDSRFVPVRPAFTAIAFDDDVMYLINAWKKDGFQLRLFQDELDQTSMTLKGIKGTVRMECEYR